MTHMDPAALAATPLPTPAQLEQDHPLSPAATEKIAHTRQQVIDILEGDDDRLIMVVGPCSEDDSLQPDGTPSVLAYARDIQQLAQEQEVYQKLLIIMRCPPAKPRSDLGMAGLEQKDVSTAHRLLTEIANLGVPLAMEVMEPEHIARYGNLISLHWVGARNNRDTMLRHALSAYPNLPVMIKNDEYGDLKPALQAIATINQSHQNARITLADGRTGYVNQTAGNPHTGLIWRGGNQYMSPEGFEQGMQKAAESSQPYGVDCSHGNTVAHDPKQEKSVAGQKACFQHMLQFLKHDTLMVRPKLIMLESYLLEDRDISQQTPGKSWTDPCINITDTKEMIRRLAAIL